MTYLTDTIDRIQKNFPRYGIPFTGPVESMEDFEAHYFSPMAEQASELYSLLRFSDVRAFWYLLYMVVMHNRCGKPVFRLDNNLVEKLLLTDLPKCSIDFLKLPFPCIVLDISRSKIKISETTLTYIFIAATDDYFRIYGACEDSTGIFANLIMQFNNDVQTIHDSFTVTIAQAMKNKSPFTDTKILDAFSQVGKNTHWSEEKDVFVLEYKRMIILAINAVLYITSPDADIVRENEQEIQELKQKLQKAKKGIKRTHYEKLLASAKNRNIKIVGKSISSLDPKETQSTDKKMYYRHQVRGHWRFVPYGSKSEQRKQQWISPYWRGPDMASLLARNYVVELPEKESR